MNERPLNVSELTPEEIAEWDRFEAQQRPGLDLVNCINCLDRSGTRCLVLGHPHVPLALNHRCAHFRAKRAA